MDEKKENKQFIRDEVAGLLSYVSNLFEEAEMKAMDTKERAVDRMGGQRGVTNTIPFDSPDTDAEIKEELKMFEAAVMCKAVDYRDAISSKFEIDLVNGILPFEREGGSEGDDVDLENLKEEHSYMKDELMCAGRYLFAILELIEKELKPQVLAAIKDETGENSVEDVYALVGETVGGIKDDLAGEFQFEDDEIISDDYESKDDV